MARSKEQLKAMFAAMSRLKGSSRRKDRMAMRMLDAMDRAGVRNPYIVPPRAPRTKRRRLRSIAREAGPAWKR